MKLLHFAWLWSLCLLLCAVLSAHADDGAITGVVRDQKGKPLGGATITLTGSTMQTMQQTRSSLSGQYSISVPAAGDYIVKGELAGYESSTAPIVHLNAATSSATVDLVLVEGAATDAAVMPARPALKFQASGIRGLIDPGGYSASTSGAATGLLRGIADIKRIDRGAGTASAKEWPCSLEPELQQALAAHPDETAANQRLGQFYLAHGRPSKAIPLLKKALQGNRKDYAVARDLGVALLQGGAFDEAHKFLSTLVIDQDRAELHQLLARAYEGSGMFLQAAQEYRVADTQEATEESVFGQGYELILAGNPADAIPVLQAGQQRYPHSIPLRIGLGVAQFLAGKTSQAIGSFLDATDIDPVDSRPYAFLAASAGTWGENAARIRSAFKRYLEMKPDSALANYWYALALSRDATNADASHIEHLLTRAIQLDQGLAKAHLLLADTYADRQDYAASIAEYEVAIRLTPDVSEAHYRLAIAYKRTDHAELSAKEMQMFQQARTRETAKASGEGVNLAQFISVMDAPEQQSSIEAQCPVASK